LLGLFRAREDICPFSSLPLGPPAPQQPTPSPCHVWPLCPRTLRFDTAHVTSGIMFLHAFVWYFWPKKLECERAEALYPPPGSPQHLQLKRQGAPKCAWALRAAPDPISHTVLGFWAIYGKWSLLIAPSYPPPEEASRVSKVSPCTAQEEEWGEHCQSLPLPGSVQRGNSPLLSSR
jgi:hypothetical protein